MDDLTERARDAIRLYWGGLSTDRSPTATVREIDVELFA